MPFLAYSVLALLLTFPLVLNLSSRLPYDLGDPLLTAAVLWWNANATPFTERWWNGFGFFPADGSTAFSADQLGASLLTTPLQWVGVNPVAAYNVTFLLSWPLSATAAHACALTLTGRRDAAIVAGLAYGFNPLRVAHLEHLELLMAFGMPAALWALHRYLQTARLTWAAAFGLALVAQAVSSSYYALFFTVFFALWLAWFIRPAEWRKAVPLVAAGAAAVALLAPVYLGYSRIHDQYGMQRKFEEVLAYSADVSSLVTASALSALWGWTAPLNGGERQLFPGLTITALAALGATMLWRSGRGESMTSPRIRRLCLAAAAGFLAIAASVALVGPWRLEVGPLRASATDLFKPLSVAVALAVIAGALSGTMRAAVRERSALAFYLLAAGVLFGCSFGPEPTLVGRRILYEPPYAWLMRLPFFDDTIRVPARFGMLAVLALALAGSLAYTRLVASARRPALIAAIVIAGVLADGAMRPLPLATPPASFAVPAAAASAAAVLELPLGDVFRDTAAMYRVTIHGKRTVNGYNGYDPLYYHVLRLSLATGDATALDALAVRGSLLVAIDARTPDHERWTTLVARRPGAQSVGTSAGWSLFMLPQRPAPAPPPCAGSSAVVAGAAFDGSPLDLAPITDGNPDTRWITPGPQREGNTLVLQLARAQPVCGVEIAAAREGELYPRSLEVATSTDGATWNVLAANDMGGVAMEAVLREPRDARARVALPPTEARFLRLRLRRSDPIYQWAIADLRVFGSH